jgi:16S rRNA (uracil1498-N3)-methyltransferase
MELHDIFAKGPVMPQFFVDKTLIAGSDVQIRGADAHHISQVLRLAANDWIMLSDGSGRSFRAIITRSSPREVLASVKEEITRHHGLPPPTLALAIIKGDRFEWALQKAVELGCRRIIPFQSARTVPQYANAATSSKQKRWQKIAHEAAKQSGLPFIPQIDAPQKFATIFNSPKDHGNIVLLYEGERACDIKKFWRESAANSARKDAPDLLVVGPEGGFGAHEVEIAKESGAITASLGTQILRVETAAITALAIWQYELGNLSLS